MGAWWVDADLVEPVALSGGVEVKCADVTAQGAIVSGGIVHGKAAYRIVGGKGGWGTSLPAKPYHNDALIKVATVLADAARECGEAVGALPTTRLGPHYARAAGPGFETLNLLAPGAWYVDFPGVTQFGARASSVYTGDGTRSRIDPAAGVVDIATDVIANLLPGVIVDGAAPATDVEYDLDPKRLTVHVYAKRGLSRRLDAWRRIILALFPEMRYRGMWEYRVTTQDGDRLNLQPVRVASGMPSLARVPIRPGMAGLRADVQLGELVLVSFADSDPSRPNVVAHDAPDAPGWLPDLVEVGSATDFLAKASETNARLQALEQWSSTVVFPTGVGPSGTGTPPFQAGAGDVATSLLKAQ